ncbi:winged helix DNA-binding domain-containing protein [Streptomyces liangshanensis]|nr:winged helix DNA-binding domain-containing protein [Streptomyces liangshanensis]
MRTTLTPDTDQPPAGSPAPYGQSAPAGRRRDTMTPTLTPRDLNRATLQRQLLTERVKDLSAVQVIELLVGLQAQDPDPPYIGLWSRIAGFRLDDLTRSLDDREVVRATLFRGTQHLLAAQDYLWLRPLLQPMLDRWQKGGFGRFTKGLDLAELADFARELLRDAELTRPELGRALTERWPGRDPVALARSVQGLLQIVHPPPNGTWGRHGTTPFALADRYLARQAEAGTRERAGAAGESEARRPPAQNLLLRYLAAFGPASVRDVQAWSGMSRLAEVADALRPRLRVFRTETGTELFDLPDAPLPAPDTPVPVRFLAALDNIVLGHADRSRMMADDRRKHVIVEAALLVDGFVEGLWNIKRQKGVATLTVKLFAPLSGSDEDAVAEEGTRLLRFAAEGAETHRLRFAPVGENG